MKKQLLGLVLTVVLCLPLIACAGQPDYVEGLSLEQAGITLTVPADALAELPANPLAHPADIRLDLLLSESSIGLSSKTLQQYGFLNVGGRLTEWGLSWSETDREHLLAPGVQTVIGVFQAYRKADVNAGKVIRVGFSSALAPRAEVTPQFDGEYTLLLSGNQIRDSVYFVGETADYYLFDWFDLIVDDPNWYACRNVFTGEQTTDGAALEINLTAYLRTIPVARERLREAAILTQTD